MTLLTLWRRALRRLRCAVGWLMGSRCRALGHHVWEWSDTFPPANARCCCRRRLWKDRAKEPRP
jgi:hypothetical protein